MTMPVTSAAGSSTPIGDTTTSTAQETGTASLLQPNTFLNLLVDELKYQNPLDPTSSADFMGQIAQLSQVEQLQSVSSSSQMDEAADLIGKSVTASSGDGTITGVVSGVTNGSDGPLLDVGTSAVDVEALAGATTGAGEAFGMEPIEEPPAAPLLVHQVDDREVHEVGSEEIKSSGPDDQKNRPAHG